MKPHGIMRALVAALLALIVGATALVERSGAGVATIGEPSAEMQRGDVAVVPSLPRIAVALPDLADDALSTADIDHVAQRHVAACVHAGVPAPRPHARHSTYPARGPPGSAL